MPERDVGIATPRGLVEVARVFTRQQAERVAALVEDAYRAFLRRRG